MYPGRSSLSAEEDKGPCNADIQDSALAEV